MSASSASEVDNIISKMSTRQNVTQMIMMEFRVWDSDGSATKDFTVMNSDVRKTLEDYDFDAVILIFNNTKTTEDTFLWRYENQPDGTGSVDNFNDASSIAEPYVQAVAWAVEEGSTVGYGDNTFRPNDVCTR